MNKLTKNNLYIKYFQPCLWSLIFLSSSFYLQADSQVDSLKQVLQQTHTPEKRLELLNTMAQSLRHTDEKQSYQYSLQAMKIAKSIPDNYHALEAGLVLGVIYHKRGQHDSLLIMSKQAMEKAKKQGYTELQVRALKNLAVVEQEKGSQIKALILYNQALKLKDNLPIKDKNLMTVILANNMGNIYLDQGLNEKAISSFQIALEGAVAMKAPMREAIILANIARVYEKVPNYSTAIEHYHKSIKIREIHGNKASILHPLNNIIGCYNNMKDSLDLAIQYAKKGYALATQVDRPNYQAFMLLKQGKAYAIQENLIEAEHSRNLAAKVIDENGIEGDILRHSMELNGNILFQKKQYAAALRQYNEILDFAILQNDIVAQLLAKEALVRIYEAQSNTLAALNLYKEYHASKDSITAANNIKGLAILEAEFINRENEQTITLLEKDKAILHIQSRQSRIIAVAVALLALLGFSFFWNARRKNRIIQQQNTELEQLNAAKDQLFAIIGHDLRKPALAFRGISRKINYLLQRQAFEKLNRMGDQLEKSAFALNGLLDNLLNWALQQRNVLPYSPQRFNVQEATAEIYTLFQPIATDKEVSLEMNISPEVSVFSDANAFSTIVRNLMDNAIKFTPEGGIVSLTAEQIGEQIKLNVTDTGIGIAPEKTAQIFELQANKSTYDTQGVKSSGLGLTLVRELVELNQGTIELFSTLGKGTRFEVFLPQ